MLFTPARLERDGIHTTDIDGVPAFYTESPGPLKAGLIFRCGVADETLLTRGATHLIEHLTLHGLQSPSLAMNGSVGQTATWFHAQGDPEDVGNFLTSVAAKTSRLPFTRIERERAVLEIESEQGGPLDSILRRRYGTATYGLEGYAQLGLKRMTDEEIAAHAARFFTRQNCALFFTGRPPANLTLDLPDGSLMRAPDPRKDLIIGGPAYFPGFSDAITMHSPIARGTAAAAVSYALDQRLRNALRFDQGISYSPHIGYAAMCADAAVIGGVIDSRAEHVDEAAKVTLDIIEALASGAAPLTDDELGDLRKTSKLGQESFLTARERGAMYADRLIHELDVPDDVIAEIDELTPDDISAAAKEFRRHLVVAVPRSAQRVFSDWQPLEPGHVPMVDGDRYYERETPEKFSVLIGRDGATICERDAMAYTVRDVAAMLTYDNGHRVLLGSDSSTIDLDPAYLHRGDRARQQLDEYFADVVVPMGAWDGEPFKASKFRKVEIFATALFALFLVLAIATGQWWAAPLWLVAIVGANCRLILPRLLSGKPAKRSQVTGEPLIVDRRQDFIKSLVGKKKS